MGSSFSKGIVGGLVLLLLCGAGIIGLTLVGTTATNASCGEGGVPGTASPAVGGPLGGLAGTGITQAEYDTVNASGGATGRLRGGTFETTSYGPPWGGIQGAGIATAGGLLINGGAPRKYFVAADPSVLGLGEWVYVTPNPFGWKGAFLVADTGGAIKGQKLDFYDWRGRTDQLGWGRRDVQVSTSPPIGEAAPVPATGEADDEPIVFDSTCSSGSSSAGELRVPTGLSRSEIANHPLITFTASCARLEVATGYTDQRVVDILGAVLESGRSLIITAMGCDHSPGTNHRPGRAADIGSVDGKICNPYGPDDACGKLAIEFGQLSGDWKSTELIASFDPNPADPASWADPVGHVHHIHLGFDG